MPATKLLCKSKDGRPVFYDPINSHTATHFDDAPSLKSLVIEVIEGREISINKLAFDIDMGRVIGVSDVVEVDETDEIVYAMRRLREDQGRVPFTKSRKSQPSTYISIYLTELEDSAYELTSAWIGEFEEPSFPEMDNATAASIPYWDKHAFAWGSQEIIAGSETSICPW